MRPAISSRQMVREASALPVVDGVWVFWHRPMPIFGPVQQLCCWEAIRFQHHAFASGRNSRLARRPTRPALSRPPRHGEGRNYLRTLFTDADHWDLMEVNLHPVGDRWVYLIVFTEPARGGCMDCMSVPFTVVVAMDGTAVPVTVSDSKLR